MLRAFILLLSTAALYSSGTVMAASVGDVEIHWESSGDGPALVFIHGRNRDTSDWESQVAAFEDDYRVITLDLPGHGQSGSISEDCQVSRIVFAEAVESVRAAAGVDQMVLIGHSLGGFVIGQYVLEYPQRVVGIVAADTSFHGPPLSPENSSCELESAVLATSEGIFQRTIASEDVIDSPALLVWGENSDLLPLHQQIYAGEMPGVEWPYPRARVELMSDVGHDVMLDDPSEFNRLLRDFLDELKY